MLKHTDQLRSLPLQPMVTQVDVLKEGLEEIES